MKKLIEILRETAHFDYYHEGQLFYRVDSGMRFSVPVAEVGNGKCNRTEKASALMKWLKPQYESLIGLLDEQDKLAERLRS